MVAKSENKLIFPGLAGFYESMLPIAATLVRIVVGIMFLMHVTAKFNNGPAAFAGYLSKNGLEPSLLLAYVVIFFESVGGFCVLIGLFTRFFAAALAIEIGIACLVVHLPKGYTYGPPSNGGFEYVLLIGVALLAIAMRGGGPYSVDRMIGKEL
jgi:putative oxidoreductase